MQWRQSKFILRCALPSLGVQRKICEILCKSVHFDAFICGLIKLSKYVK